MTTETGATGKHSAALLWVLAIALAIASQLLPRVLKLNERFHTGFFTAATYGMVVVLACSGIVMGALDPPRARLWAIVLGLAPLFETGVRMVREGGPGNLWPIAIVLALIFGLGPAVLGTALGKAAAGLRKRSPGED